MTTKDDLWVNVIYAGDIGDSVVLEEDHNKIVEKLLKEIEDLKETNKDLEEYRHMYENLTQ